MTERRIALSQLADSEHLVRTLIETSSNGILRFARDPNDPEFRYRCVFANRSAESFVGDAAASLVGMPLEKIESLDPERLLDHFRAEDMSKTQISYEVCYEGDDGERWSRVVAEPVGEDFSVTVVDITQRKRTEDKMLADALRDPLTGVLNRRGFEQEAAARIRRHRTDVASARPRPGLTRRRRYAAISDFSEQQRAPRFPDQSSERSAVFHPARHELLC